MSCNCNNSPCTCCEKVISKQGLPGPQGRQGIQGVAGPSNVFVKSSVVDNDYVPAAVQSMINYTVVTAGNYLIMYEGDVRFSTGDTLNYEARKNGVTITNSTRQADINPGAFPDIAKTSLTCGVVSLSAGDIVAIYFQCDSAVRLNGVSLTLIKVSNLTLL